MSIKSKGRMLGRIVRRMTGLPLPVCMRIGKSVVQGKYVDDIITKFSAVMSQEVRRCGDGCCSTPIYTIKGPKGTLQTEYTLSEHTLTKEYSLSNTLRANPGKAAVWDNENQTYIAV